MKHNENTIITLLLVTTGILSSLLVFSLIGGTDTAYADTSVRGGNYVFGTGAWSASNDLLYIINRASKQLNVYALNVNSHSLDKIGSVDLAAAFR